LIFVFPLQNSSLTPNSLPPIIRIQRFGVGVLLTPTPPPLDYYSFPLPQAPTPPFGQATWRGGRQHPYPFGEATWRRRGNLG